MKYAFAKNKIFAVVVAAVAIGGAVVVLADDRPNGPADPNQGIKGKADMGSPAGKFNHAFKSAATADARRALVMKACDDHLINSRMSLDALKELFGDSPMFIVYPLDKEMGKQSALLNFLPPAPPPPPGTGISQREHHEWYMWFLFEHDNLRLYYLTNCGK